MSSPDQIAVSPDNCGGPSRLGMIWPAQL